MTSEKLAMSIAKEEKLLEGYKRKRSEYDEKIKKSEAKLHQYKMMQNSEMFSNMSDVVAQSGLSMEALMLALQQGDLLALQEKMEAAQNKPISADEEQEESSAIEDNDAE